MAIIFTCIVTAEVSLYTVLVGSSHLVKVSVHVVGVVCSLPLWFHVFVPGL